MPLQVVSVLAVLCLAAGYVKRPSFRKPFPDPSLFKSGRRLAPEGQKPERLHFEVEDGGYHFDYDFGGIPTVEKVFNLDSDAVEGISCTGHRLKIFWSNLTVANAANLQKDAVITGSPEWGCSFSNSTRKSSKSSNFVLRILKVDQSGLTSELEVFPISPVQLFRNLYIDLSWYAVEGNGRQLQESCGNYTYGLNYDCQTQRAKDVYSVGPLACSNCFAALKATPGFQFETDSLGSPTKVAMDLSATFEINLEVSYAASANGSWKTLFDGQRSSNLLNQGLAFTMPTFGSVLGAANSWTVNIGIYAAYRLKGQADPQSSLDGILQTRQLFQWSGAQVAWTKGVGFSSELGSVSQSGNTVTPNLQELFADLRGALAPCAVLEFNYGDETMSEVTACLEGHVAYVTEKATTSVAANAIATTSQAFDEILCVDMYKFETDGDLDTSADEPYAGWCFFGKCHYREYVYFSGTSATWDTGYVCMDIQSAWLQTNRLYMEVWESDTGWDDEYIERLSEDLSDEISDLRSGVTRKYTATPTSSSGGSFADVYVHIKLTSKRLLQMSNVSACGQSLYVGPGMHGGLSGFVLPASWNHAGRLVDPISMPSYKGQMSQQICEDLPRWDAMWGFAQRSFKYSVVGMVAWTLFA